MRNVLKGNVLLIVGGLFILVVAVSVLIVLGVGRIYRERITSLEQTRSQELKLTKRAAIRKITIKKKDETGCMEVTPDGAVRVYESCGGKLVSATRLSDPRNILKLFQIVSEADVSMYRDSGAAVFELVIETDSGTQTIFVTSGGGEQVISTISQIQGDIPQPSPTVLLPQSSQITVQSPYPSPSVSSAVSSPPPNSSPPPTVGGSIPFTCDFYESGGQGKPYRVSNVVCSTEPSPVP